MPPKVIKMEVNEEEVKRTKKLMEENELKKLVREEILRRDVNEKKDDMAEKQKKVIAALHKDNANVLSSLQVMTSERQCRMDTKQAQDIADLLGQGDTLDLEIAREKRHIVDLETQILKKPDKQRRDIKRLEPVTDFGLLEENLRKEHLMESLKSRLHAEQVHLSTTIKDNEDLRKKITLQFKSKARFNDLFEELIRKLNKGKNILKDVVEQSQSTLKNRDEVSRKIQALRERDAADLHRRQEEMQDLEMKLYEDMITNDYKQKVLMTRAKLNETKKATKKDNLNQDALRQDLKELTDTLSSVKEKASVQDVQEICELFIRQEEENFSLFKYNNEIHYQLQALTEQVIKLMGRVNEEQETATNWENEQECINNKLKTALNNLEMEGLHIEEQQNASQRTFDRLLEKIETLFKMPKCNHAPLDELLGENETVTQFNYQMYLDLIETRLVELISALSLGRVDVAEVLSKVSTFTTFGKSGNRPPTVEIIDRKTITRPCAECVGDSKFRGNPMGSFL